MKNLNIGNIKTKIVTGAEINVLRMTEFNNWFIQLYENIETPSITTLLLDLKKANLVKNTPEIERLITNFEQSILLKSEGKPSAWHICFGLICSELNEDLTEVSEDFLLEKTKRFAAEGLTFETVKKEVLNFTKPSANF